MPAAAVIPAPIAYIKVVAVKKLVVGSVSGRCRTTPARRRVFAAGRSRPAGLRVPSSRPPSGARRPRLGVLVTGTSAGRIVGRLDTCPSRRSGSPGARPARPPRRAIAFRAPASAAVGGRLLQSCRAVPFTGCRRRADTFTLNKLECSKQARIWRAGLRAASVKRP